MKRFKSLKIAVFILSLHFIVASSIATAQELIAFYVLIPPMSSITIGNETVKNEDTAQGVMRFQKAFPETYLIGKTDGVKVGTLYYRIDVKPESAFKLQEEFVLQSGSIHVETRKDKVKPGKIHVDGRTITFEQADFVAFRGGGGEVVVKVLDGSVELTVDGKQQPAKAGKGELITVTPTGKLLVPQKYDEIQSPWWEEKSFTFEYEKLPVAHAGADQKVLPGFVTLDARQSDFLKGDLIIWTLEDGPVPEVTFDASKSILQPIIELKEDGIYHFSAVIKSPNGKQSNKAVVSISVGQKYLEPIEVFPDVPKDHSNNIAISYLYQKGYITGYVDETLEKVVFKPEQRVNRVEILTILLKSVGKAIPSIEEIKQLNPPLYTDVSIENWFAPVVYVAKNIGLIQGSEGTTYRAGDSVNLVEFLKMLAKLHKVNLEPFQGKSVAPYPNIDPTQWYGSLLYFNRKYNLFESDSEGKIDPAHQMTRGEIAEAIYRLETENLNQKKGYVSGLVKNKEGKTVKNSQVLVYNALPDIQNEKGEVQSWKKGDLLTRVSSKINGSFGISLPVGQMFTIQALLSEEGSVSNSFTLQIKEEEEEISTNLTLVE